jgi:hypothetical protein
MEPLIFKEKMAFYRKMPGDPDPSQNPAHMGARQDTTRFVGVTCRRSSQGDIYFMRH